MDAKNNTTVTVTPTASADAHTPKPVNMTRTAKVNITSTEQVHGRTTDFHTDRASDVTMDGEFDNHVIELLNGELAARKVAEDQRADRRNRNRILSLLVVLAFELLVPMAYGYGLLPAIFMKYEVLAITAPDAILTAYAYIRKY